MATIENPSEAMRLVRDGDAATGAQAAALFALANGLVGVEGVIDERADRPCAYVPDAYVSRPIAYHESFPGYASATDTRVACPSPVLLRLHIDGKPVDFGGADLIETESTLDLGGGQLRRLSRWRLAGGRTLEIAVDRIVPLAGAACVASRIHLRPIDFGGSVEVRLTYGIEGAGGVEADDPRISARLRPVWTIIPPLPGDPSTVTRFAQDAVELAYRQHVAAPSAEVSAEGAGHAVRGALVAGGTLTIDRVVALASARGRPVDLAAFDDVAADFHAIAESQRAAVNALWDSAAFAIDGDEALTEALRFDLFQLHQSASRDPNHSIGAKGLTGEGYEGHYFWDAEIFMLPVLALQAPDKARTLLSYRIGKLDQARAHARALGHASGALYPWRTIAGDECSSHYPTGSAQYHINGDIAYALALYVAATGDEGFRAEAAEMLFETARMWMEIGAFDARRGGAFCVYGVTGPDEYSALVDNDFYTNAIAHRHLAYAAATADWLRARGDDAQLASAIGLDDSEIADWRNAAAAMWLPVDPVLGVNPQDDAFLGRPELPGLASRDGHGPLLMRYHPMILFRHQVAKQGNVVQAMAMDLVEMPLSRQRRNFDYYSRVTTHDSTLSSVSFAIAAARLGDEAAALGFLRECAFVDLEDRHGNTSHGLHMAALAGSWLVLAEGWGGLRLGGAVPSFRPQLPAAWKGYRFRLQWRGSVIELAVDAAGCTYRLLSGAPLDIVDHGRALRVGGAPVAAPRPVLKGVIFDLDGVLTDTAEDHYHAWQALADRHGLAFDREANHRLKGVDRGGSLRLILDHAGATVDPVTFEAMLAEKNDLYRERLADYSPANLFPGVRELFAACRAAGMKIGLASASRNAPDVVHLLGIAGEFDFIADAGAVPNAKPAPDIFLACAAGMGLSPEQCIGIEDARAGISAIHAAGMVAIGIGSEEALPEADLHVPAIGDLTLGQILSTEQEAAARGRLSIRTGKVEDMPC